MDVDLQMAGAAFRVDELTAERVHAGLLPFEYIGEHVVVDERRMLFPDGELRRAKCRRAFRRLEDDRATSCEMAHFARDARHPLELVALREANEEVPVLEEIERRIETASSEIL